MELNGVQGAEQIAQLTIMKNMIKESLGDGMEFELVYQALLDDMKATTTDEGTKDIISNLANDNISGVITKSASLYGVGQNLQDIPLSLNSELGYLNSNNNLSSISRGNSVSTTSTDSNMKQIYASVNKYSKEFGVDSNLVLSVIKAESDFNPNTTSWAGAMGLMQLMPENCVEDGVTKPYDIDDNIRGGVKQLKWLLNRFNGDTSMALMGYNAGVGTMQNRGVTSTEHIYKMPKETQNYVPKVLDYYNKYAQGKL